MPRALAPQLEVSRFFTEGKIDSLKQKFSGLLQGKLGLNGCCFRAPLAFICWIFKLKSITTGAHLVSFTKRFFR